MKKIIIFGDPTFPLYHPYENVAEQLESVFKEFCVEVGEHFETFEVKDYKKYDLVVFYTDHWIDKTGTSPQQVQAAINYVATGGAWLVLHNLDLGVNEEIAQMLGARLRHPLKHQGGLRELRFMALPNHPISRGIESFDLQEECLSVDYAMFTERIELLKAEDKDGMEMLAGWAVKFGEGRVAYLSPGHTVEAFCVPAYQKLIRQAANWLMHLTEEE